MIFIPAITEHFHNLSKFSSSDFGAGSKLFLLHVWVDILHLGSGSGSRIQKPKCCGSNRSGVARSVLNISSKNIFSFFLPFDFPQYPPQKTLQITIFHLKKKHNNQKTQ